MKPIKKSNLTLEQALTTVVSTIVNQQLKNDDVLTDNSLNVKKKSEEVVVVSNSQDALGNWITLVASEGDVGKMFQVISGYDNGITFLPAVGSIVVLDYVDNNNVRINYTTGIEYIELYSAGRIVLDTPDEINISSRKQIVMNDGEYDGLIIIAELTDKLNKLVDEVNALKDKFNNHIHATIAPGVIAPTMTKATAATKFNKDDYENTGVIHGPTVKLNKELLYIPEETDPNPTVFYSTTKRRV